MTSIVKTLRLEMFEYYRTHLSIVNCLIPVKITGREIDVLSLFMCFDNDSILESDRFGTAVKKMIREKLGLSHQGLSNYMNSLTKKKMLSVEDDVIMILPILCPNRDEQTYMIKLVNIQHFIPNSTTFA
jgi:hypothetical protein